MIPATDFKPLDPIVPFKFLEGPYEDMLAALHRIRTDYGIRRFLITGPNTGVRLTGYPGMEAYREIGAVICRIKKDLSTTDIEIGWWCAPSIKCGLNAPYQHIVGNEGSESPHGLCPLDKGMADELSRKVALVAEMAKPFMIQFEDDFCLSNHPGVKGFGCLCPLHLTAFAERAGREYKAKEIEDFFRNPSAENLESRCLFNEISRDSLVNLAAAIRKAVDVVSPVTRLSLCEPGGTDRDGWLSEVVCRAFAGPATRPAIRVYGSQYYSLDSAVSLPSVTSHTMFSAENLPDDFELYHESDTYPHTRYYMSAAYLESMMYAVFAAGVDDTLFYATQYLDDPVEEVGYLDMYRRNEMRFNALRQTVSDCTLTGCRIVHAPESKWLHRLGGKNSLGSVSDLLGRYGIPYTTRGDGVRILSTRQEAAVIPDDEVLEMLGSGGVLLDAEAALCLAERGFSELIGVDVRPLSKLLASTEKILPAAGVPHVRGSKIYNLSFLLPAGPGDVYVQLELKGADELVSFLDPRGTSIGPQLTRYVNRLGGRIGVIAASINNSASFYSYRKREVIRTLLKFLNGGDLPCTVLKAPNVWLLCNKAKDDSFLLLNIVNLCSDTLDGMELLLAPKYRGAAVLELDASGEWHAANIETTSEVTFIKGAFRHLATRIFKIWPPVGEVEHAIS